MIEQMENFFFTTLRGYFATLPFLVGQHGACSPHLQMALKMLDVITKMEVAT
jgi:hypothetical protein